MLNVKKTSKAVGEKALAAVRRLSQSGGAGVFAALEWRPLGKRDFLEAGITRLLPNLTLDGILCVANSLFADISVLVSA